MSKNSGFLTQKDPGFLTQKDPDIFWGGGGILQMSKRFYKYRPKDKQKNLNFQVKSAYICKAVLEVSVIIKQI